MPIKQTHTKSTPYAIIITMLLLVFFYTGCKPTGKPKLPDKPGNSGFNHDLYNAVTALYSNNETDVLKGLKQISEMKQNGADAIPWVTPLLEDARLVKSWSHGFAAIGPIAKEAGKTLGCVGIDGVRALIGSLKNDEQTPGMQDDLKRESVSEGLKKAISLWSGSLFSSLKDSDGVLYLLNSAEICHSLDSTPGRADRYDPRRILKYQLHFADVSKREGLKIFIECLGFSGDNRALPFLNKIAQINSAPPGLPDEFEKAALLAQYRIKPVPAQAMAPVNARFLLTEFVFTDNIQGVKTLLSQGISADTRSFTFKPMIELAWSQKHPEVLQLLIDKGASLNTRLQENNTLLIRAAKKGDVDTVRQLLKGGADIHLTNHDDQTALVACIHMLFTFWNEKPDAKDARSYFKTIHLLQNAGSPSISKEALEDYSEKALNLLNLKTH